MRVVHLTDLHLFRSPPAGHRLGKRLVGLVNLELLGRRRRFSEDSFRRAVQDIVALRPDVVVSTGDLTALALPLEFEIAREILEPITSSIPFVLVPGNHDVYTRRAAEERRIENYFGTFTGGGTYPSVHRHGDVVFIGLDPCEFHPLLSNGHVPETQLRVLRDLLVPGSFSGCAVVLLLHYPILGRRGGLYQPFTRNLSNAARLLEVLGEGRLPDLIIHGHVHHGYTVGLPFGGVTVPIHNPGAGGYTPSDSRNACFNLYTIDGKGFSGAERYTLQGDHFRPEPGGSYQSGA